MKSANMSCSLVIFLFFISQSFSTGQGEQGSKAELSTTRHRASGGYVPASLKLPNKNAEKMRKMMLTEEAMEIPETSSRYGWHSAMKSLQAILRKELQQRLMNESLPSSSSPTTSTANPKYFYYPSVRQRILTSTA